ncbi:MAG: hypothetical protein A3G23_08505 [Bacteroidetes bacterium RIFCSPLOWO2_12_FULL_37_12]|nr:MAG: hypothetical protein A3G23_08505 [Bacteroidetes bacterium RIFCSPLOWO2_12_FULL_37_12]
MKNHFISNWFLPFTFILFFNNFLSAQWNWSNPPLGANTLKSISIVPGKSELFAVGDKGTLVKYNFSGTQQQKISLNTERNLNSIVFTSSTTGYVCGTNNLLLKTSDGGNTWVTLTAESFSDEGDNNSLYFFNDSVGFLTGNMKKILKTTNGGLTWDTLSYDVQSGYREYYSKIYFVNSTLGFISGYSNVNYTKKYFLRTQDGGNIWDTLNIGNRVISSISFVNDSVGFIGGSYYNFPYNFLFKTVNKGNSWDTITLPQSNNLQTIYFINKDTGLIFMNGYIFRTFNGGVSWLSYYEPNYLYMYSVACLTKDTLFAVGEGGLVLQTVNGGAQWDPISKNNVNDLVDISFPSDSVGYAVGNANVFLKTTDGGLTWNKVNATNFINNPVSLHFISEDTGFVTGYAGLLLKTIDGGMNWANLNSGTPYYLGDITFTSKLRGFAVGGSSQDSLGVVSKTEDGGATWTSNIIAKDFFMAVDFPTQSTGYIVGGYTTSQIYKSMDGGMNWAKLSFPDSTQIAAVHFINDTVGFISVYNKGIYKTTNGGITWKASTASYPSDIFFVNDSTGYSTGGYGFIYKTIDQGENWFIQSSPTNLSLNKIYFTNQQNGVICGADGAILYTSNSGKKCNPVKFSASDTSFCTPGYNIQFNSWDSGQDNYSWKKNGIQWGTYKNGNLTFDSAGIFKITLVESSPECVDSANLLIYAFKTPSASFESQKWDAVTVNFKHSDSLATSVWKWNFGDSTYSTVSNPTHKYSADGNYNVALKVFSKDSCRDSSLYSININSSVDENEFFDFSFDIFPNPGTNLITLSFDVKEASPLYFNIYDITGREINKFQFIPSAPGKGMIELNNYFNVTDTGFYLLKISNQKKTAFKKLIYDSVHN